MKKCRRLGIGVFYDANGIVDRYVSFYLEGLRPYLEDILIVANGSLTDEGRHILEGFGRVVVRENQGYDLGAWKTGVEDVGWQDFIAYDEVILFNFSCFGPLFSLEKMFSVMETKRADFWGITKTFESKYLASGLYCALPESIESFFIAIRGSMLNNPTFKGVWDGLETPDDKTVRDRYSFTKIWEELGFVGGVYVFLDDLENLTPFPMLDIPEELVSNRGCPFILRKIFNSPYSLDLIRTDGRSTQDVLSYIRKRLSYDVEMIHENILRTMNQADIHTHLHHNWILPLCYSIRPPGVEKERIAAVLHSYYPDQVELCLEYLRSMPSYADIYVTTNSEKQADLVKEKFKDLPCRKLIIRLVPNRGRSESALLVGCADIVAHYDIICFVHDKKSSVVRPGLNGLDFFRRCMDNLLASPLFVENILDTFRREKRLGMLMPPPPNHGFYYHVLGSEWGGNYANVEALLKKLNVQIPISPNKEHVSPLGGMFWFRTEALRALFAYGWKYDDFPEEPLELDGTLLHALERSYGSFAQQAGYHVGWVLSDYTAQRELTNLNTMIRKINYSLIYNVGVYDFYSFGMFVDRLKSLASDGSINPVGLATPPCLFKRIIKKLIPKKILHRLSVWCNMREVG